MKIFRKQFWHLILLVILVSSVMEWKMEFMSEMTGELFGISSTDWFYLGLLIPILHQLYVLLCWRVELYYEGISKIFGEKGFTLYKAGFAVLILSRPIVITVLAIVTSETFELGEIATWVWAITLLVPALYLFYSVARYFGSDRAFGYDHFYPEEAKNMPMVNKGIFRYTKNGMYTFGFLILYVPGFIWHSEPALIVAIFNHLYIWVHYFFVEKPDIEKIYG